MPPLKMSLGKIFVSSMNLRGAWGEIPQIDNGKKTIRINVTSAQPICETRMVFSPMTPIDGGYKGFLNFEAYWQSGKVFENIDNEKKINWWKTIKTPKRRFPNSKGKRVLYSIWEEHSEKMDYITSRKKVYVPEYAKLVINSEKLKDFIEMRKTHNIIICDFDGPRTNNGGVQTLELTKELLHEKINDIRFPFGHGYIVGSLLLGIDVQEIC